MNVWPRRIAFALFVVTSSFSMVGLSTLAQSGDSDTAEVGLVVTSGNETPTTTATATSTVTSTATATATATSTSLARDSEVPVVSKLPDTGMSPEYSAGVQWMSAAIAAGFFLATVGMISSRSGEKRRVE